MLDVMHYDQTIAVQQNVHISPVVKATTPISMATVTVMTGVILKNMSDTTDAIPTPKRTINCK